MKKIRFFKSCLEKVTKRVVLVPSTQKRALFVFSWLKGAVESNFIFLQKCEMLMNFIVLQETFGISE